MFSPPPHGGLRSQGQYLQAFFSTGALKEALQDLADYLRLIPSYPNVNTPRHALTAWAENKQGESTVSKLSAGDVLISPNPMPCQEEGCRRETYFAIMIPWTTRSLCPDHLYPRLRKRSLDKLFLDLGTVIYQASFRYVTMLFEDEPRAFQEIPQDERQDLPLGDVISTLCGGNPDEHYERVPLRQLTEVLARMNAQAVVAAMGGREFMQRKSAAREQEGQDQIAQASP